MHRFEPPKAGKKALSTSLVSSLDFPSVVTIFSAPNYCGSYDNKAAFFQLDRGQVKLKQFNETPAPYKLPHGLNVFSWSAPFLADRIVNMFANLLKQAKTTTDKEEAEAASVAQEVTSQQKALEEKH